MNILMLSYCFGVGASGIISYRVAAELKRQGHIVFVITGTNSVVDNSLRIYVCPNVLSDQSLCMRLYRNIYRNITKDTLDYNYFWRYRAFHKAKELVKSNKIDWIYSRSTPIDANIVGYNLKKRYKIKVLQHFVDPVISDFSTKNNCILHFLKKKFRKILLNADLVSYGTLEMLKHQECILGIDLSKKSFVSPDASSSNVFRIESFTKSDKIRLTFLGSFGISRNPYPLFRAVDRLNKLGNKIILNVYSEKAKTLLYEGKDVIFRGCVPDIDKVLKDTDICIDLDITKEDSPFISSKLKDYILINRPILSVTSCKSAMHDLCKGMCTIKCCNNDEESISREILSLVKTSFSNDDYLERKKMVDYFSPQSVVKKIVEQLIIKSI